ncbi:MAG: altronate dehydratase family protein [Alphaproteobacteria bacterium]
MEILKIHPADNIFIALKELPIGTPLEEGVFTKEPIRQGHKVAGQRIPKGSIVLKFAQPIGIASRDIAAGEHVHLHNLSYIPSSSNHSYGSASREVPHTKLANFQGIIRPNGQIATRNYIGILTSVNCSATVARHIADQFRGSILEQWPNVDGVVALTHKTGCGMASEGEAMNILRRTIGGYARHPNFFGILIVGLGCEANQVDRLLDAEDLSPSENLFDLIIQEEGGSSATVRGGVSKIKAMLDKANKIERQSVSVSHLKLGLQCGGSDGFSALTANPALGVASDILVQHGGTAVLSETPEIYGAEHILLSRAVSRDIADKLLERLSWWQAYTSRTGETLDNNPSPGNKEGGLTTILEKSLGAVAKGGTSPLVDVVQFAETLKTSGFVFMDTPGYDPVSVTGQVAGGCNIVCFTTGRGSCFGCKPVPSLKLATNTPMYRRMIEDMDINCGEIIDGTATVEEMGRKIFDLIVATASGKKTASERLGYGEDEFVPWVIGATV